VTRGRIVRLATRNFLLVSMWDTWMVSSIPGFWDLGTTTSCPTILSSMPGKFPRVLSPFDRTAKYSVISRKSLFRKSFAELYFAWDYRMQLWILTKVVLSRQLYLSVRQGQDCNVNDVLHLSPFFPPFMYSTPFLCAYSNKQTSVRRETRVVNTCSNALCTNARCANGIYSLFAHLHA